ncbi:N-acetylmuramidase domain-containing protein [Pseudoalteromonas luteoviolacea]|uniref:Peptidoglycan-binding protein n=1 Tax=Pseudoalteromonas luteoviolacea NCIMB 1942 TaxID=1365253 RepID=A0A166Z6N3_9GAMM|nr:N-acetylmuramidase family protein [Pseudoalteromonas luteoviolacea]KZN43992.1 hypothetical protein N482_18035 [Pseudoalteromonas luteoviolacea NCIMB 1942]
MKLTIGSKSQQVKDLQTMLNNNGAALDVDGWFGDLTSKAVADYQKQLNLPMTGYAGKRTLAVLNGEPRAKFLSLTDMQFAAEQLDVPTAVIAAVAEVESNGCGFFDCGRPSILFERHVFYRIVSQKSKDFAASVSNKYPNICNPKPGGYIGGSGEYQRFSNAATLEFAYMLDKDAAISACSWGMFQIMGYHFSLLGYSSANDFKLDMEISERNQLLALVKFIKADSNMHKALKGHKWAEFAKRYNGPNYKKNLYDVKLAQAYADALALMPEEQAA